MKQDQQLMRESLITKNSSLDSDNYPSPDIKDSTLIKLKPLNGSNIFQRMFFTWVSPLISLGSKQSITVDIMPILPHDLQTQNQYNLFYNNFQNVIKSPIEGWTLSKIILKTFSCQFLKILFMTFILISLSTFSPFLTSLIIGYIQNRSDYDLSFGIILFITILITSFIKSIFQTQMFYRFSQLGINLTNSLTMMIYCKSFKYASNAEKQFSESDIINFSQVDAEKMTDMGFQMACLLLTPLQIVAGIAMMYWFIGISFLAGIGVMLLMIGFTFFLMKYVVKYNEAVLKVKDQRMKVTQQMLNIIRYIKINAIQKFFYRKLEVRRAEQIEMYKKKGFMSVINIFVYWVSCPLILSATFFTYIQLGNQMNSTVAFTTIMIFSTLQYPIRLLPTAIQQLIQIYTSIKRIQKYLFTEEIKTDHFSQVVDKECSFAVKIEGGNFYWGAEKSKEKEEKQKKKKLKKQQKKMKDQEDILSSNADKSSSISEQQYQSESDFQNNPSTVNAPASLNQEQRKKVQQKSKYVKVLKDINTTIGKGKFTLLIGDIGSGKSSLLLAILNEMRSSSKTKVQINGKIAYAAQKPWIMSATVKQNILFQLPFEEEKFNRVLHFASLQQDIKILPKGVETEIGEKGVNLSGGQKTRISLARALYSQQDIYLLDDVLSAVDVHVGDFLMRWTLLGYLKGKTIIMPTHALKFAEFADQLVIMKKGRIVRKGHFNDISKTTEFQQIYLKQKNKESKSEDQQGQSEQQKVETEMAMLRDVLKHKSEYKNETQAVAVADRLVQEMMLPEDHKIGKVDFSIFNEYLKLNGGVFRFGVFVSLVMFFWFVFTTSSSIVMEYWCQNPIGQNYDLYIYMGFAILANVFIFIRAYTLILSGARQGQIVHKNMIKALLYTSLGKFYNRIPIGRIVNRLTKDLRQLDEEIGYAIGGFLVCSFQLLGTLTISIYGSTIYILIPIVLVAYLSHRVRRYYMTTQRQIARFQKSTNSPIVSGFMSSISGLSTIRAYKKQQKFIDKQIIKIDQNKKVRLNKSGLESWFSINLTYLSFFVNMTAIGYCILSDNDNASLAGLLMNYALNLSDDIIGVTQTFAFFQTKIISLERIYNFMQIQPEESYTQYCLDWDPKQEGYRQVVTKGQIQFVDLHVKYRSDLPDVLNGLNCKIIPCQKIGIVGRTGAGKTTIINTLLRITEISGGSLLIDGTSLQTYSLKDLRNAITMIDQEPTLIKSTFKENLDITGRYTDEELLSILKECNLYETIIEKGGLEGSVSNDSLSAGEKQLLCICRAFLKKSKIVLVDEATANIDMKNDQIIQRVINDKFKECTVLTIAHRLSTLKHSDKIIVMENGRIIQFGTPTELENKPDGFYREMILKNSKEFLT